MQYRKFWAQSVQLGDYAVVLGGARSNRGVHAFDTVEERWTEWESTHNSGFGAASDGVRLIVAGGVSPLSRTTVSDVYELNKAHDDWLKLPSMPKACSSCSATIMKNKLYIMIDERVENTYRTIAQVLNLKDCTWSEITLSSTIPGRVSSGWRQHRLAVLDDFIVSDRLVAYDTASGRSKDLPSPPGSEPDAIQTLAAVDGRLLAFGKATLPASAKVHMLSSDHQRWDELPSMTTARCAPSACTVNGVVYIFGGVAAPFEILRTSECFK